MPYVDLPETGVALWYRTNMEMYNGKLRWDAQRPIILLLQGTLSTPFLSRQFDDPTLDNTFNLVAFDVRSTGETKNPLDARRDTWVDAADLAHAAILLGLPSFHVFAAGSQLVHLYALRLALLWPNLLKSIAFIDAGARPEDSSVVAMTDDDMTEAMRELAICDDLETFEWLGHETATWVFGSGVPEDMIDRVVEDLELHYSGMQSPRFYDLVMGLLHEPSLDTYLLRHLIRPILYIRSEFTTEVRSDVVIRPTDLLNAQVHTEILRSPPQPHTREPWCHHINSCFKEFVMDQPDKLSLPETIPCDSMRMALQRLSELTGRSDLLERNPLMSSSFSLVHEDVIQKRRQIAAELVSLCKTKSPGTIVDNNGIPIRKYSERHMSYYSRLYAAPSTAPFFLSVSEVVESHEEGSIPE
ncbi:hypothetical protein CALCODRAFT_263528 [Calocera cornea HHB12733]|uniref:Alpha/beta-hydrolase n=1 Tax=Calocera cornea HHB12733 TaxID=1353952 RepID=A0A165GCA7_9BASI|nr:hypothetical protein CALCODRAFT_263528 [Calocera cornea HHB12733]